jgi:tetratricopeptide (TPR) repeat protein
MQSLSANDFPGSQRFVIRSRVGQGAVGVVYDAFDVERNTRVALKTLRVSDPEAVLSLKTEFRAVQDLLHPNLVRMGELFEQAGTWYFTMEFIEGTHFVRYVRPGDPNVRSSIVGEAPRPASAHEAVPARFDVARLRATLPQLVRGIMALHDAGKVHRDVKPSNVLVMDDGRVVLLDFGVAGDLVRDVEETDPGLVGTALYMSPEQALGQPAGPESDWYAVGVVLYEVLTGRLPYVGQLHELIAQKMERPPAPPSRSVSGIPRDLEELCLDLMRVARSERPDGPAILARLGVPVRTGEISGPNVGGGIFVGREEELTALGDALRDATAATRGRREAVTVFVHGESGVGKTFLVRRLLGMLRSEVHPPLVLDGRCLERESVPYKAVDGAIDQLSTHIAALPEAEQAALFPADAALLARAFPVLGRSIRTNAGDVEAENPAALRPRMFAAMRELLRRVAARRPIVLAIDDLQWADNDSLALLAEVTRPPNAPAMLVVATIRLTTERQNAANLERLKPLRIEGDVRHIHLGQLPPEEARALASRLMGGDGDRAAIESIVGEAGGHPLFIDELVRQRSSIRSLKALKLEDALWFRVERLAPLERRLLELVAVAGAPILQGIAADAAGIDLGQLFELAAVLRIEHFVKTGGSRPEDPIEPYHDRVREAVLGHVEGDSRARWHGRIATALERAKSDDAEALATHWHGAGNAPRAADYAARAGDRAMQSLAFERAARLYRLALGLHAHAPEVTRELKTKLAEAHAHAGFVSEAAEVHLALAAESSGETAIDLRRRASEELLCSGRYDQGVEILRSVLVDVGVYFPRTPLTVIVSLLVTRLFLLLRGLSFRTKDPAQTSAAERVRVDAAWSAGAGFAMSDNIRGAYFQTRSLLFCLHMGDVHRIVRSLSMEICFRSTGGSRSREATRALLARDWELARKVGTPEALGMAYAATGYAHYMTGEWREALAAFVSSEEFFRDRCVGVAFMLGSVRIMLYRTLQYTGDIPEIAARVPPVLRDADRQSDDYLYVNLQAGPMALLALADDRPDRIREALPSVGRKLARRAFLIQHYFALQAECLVDLYTGDATAALGRLHASWPALRRSLLLRVQAVRVMAYEQRCRCAIAAASSRMASGGELLAAATADAQRIAHEKTPWTDASSAMLLGSIAAARGDTQSARKLLDEAASRFTALDMALSAASTRRRLGELLGGDQGAAMVSDADAWFADHGVKNPARMSAILLPPLPSGT